MEWLTIARLRYRQFIAKLDRRVVVVLFVVGLLFAGAGLATAASPPTETVQQPTDTIVVTTTQTTAATVTGETDMYDRGEVVRDSPLYLTDAAPNVSVTARVGTDADQRLTVDQRLTLVYEAREDEETFWERRETVARSSESVNEGNATVSATLNASEILAEQGSLNAEIGRQATVRAALVHSASYSTGEYDGEFTNDARISVSDNTYSVGNGIDDSVSHLERQHITRPIESEFYDISALGTARSVPKRTLQFLLAAVACWLVGGHAAIATRRSSDVDGMERELTHRRFESWISQARVSDEMITRRVSVDSLADLVDVAIDVNSRVVYDSIRNQYIVFADNATYIYDPASAISSSWGGSGNTDATNAERNGRIGEDDREWAGDGDKSSADADLEQVGEVDESSTEAGLERTDGGDESGTAGAFEWTDDEDASDTADEFDWTDAN